MTGQILRYERDKIASEDVRGKVYIYITHHKSLFDEKSASFSRRRWRGDCLTYRNNPHRNIFVAIDFSDRILVVHPTAFDLGRSILFLGLIAIAVGVVTCFTSAFLVPALAWFAMAVPTLAVGVILVGFSVTRP